MDTLNSLLKIILITLLLIAAKPILANSLKDEIVEGNKKVSKEIDSLAQELDTLLSNRKGAPYNKSTVSLLGFFQSWEGGETQESAHLSVDLRLPKLEKKWQLRFSSYDREDEFEGNSRNRDGARPAEQKYGTSIGLLRKIGKVDTLFRPRIEFKNPLETSFLIKFSSRIDTSIGEFNWNKKFFAHSLNGVGQSLALDYNKELSDYLVFQIFNESQYLDKDNLFRVSQGPSFRFRLTDVMALSTTLSLNSQNRVLTPAGTVIDSIASSYHLNNYQATVTFSHKLLKRVFHYQISPLLNFAKSRSFKGQAGLVVRTEIIF